MKAHKKTQTGRVDHREAKMPDPRQELIESIAHTLFDTMVENNEIRNGEGDPLCHNWEQLTDGNKDSFRQMARNAYGTIALWGGAKLTSKGGE